MSNSDSPLLSGADNDISLSEDSTHEVKQGLAALTLGAILLRFSEKEYRDVIAEKFGE